MLEKRTRKSIYDLFNNYPDEFGRFIIALDAFKKSADWLRICGIHGLTFDPLDKEILCPTDPSIISQITGIGEPQYCPHGVSHFLIWHTIYLLEFEFLLNKYNQSINENFISLPWLDFSNIEKNDYSFMSNNMITITFDSKNITIPNPLINGNIYLNGTIIKTTRNGFLNPKTSIQKQQIKNIQQEFNESFNIINYESISSVNIPKKRTTISNTIPLESSHNTIHTCIGGKGGAMSAITKAAHDPIFWLHHCNIDRYFYNWFTNITNNFTQKMSRDNILPETLQLKLVPFLSSQINLLSNDDFKSYKFCWQNNTNNYLLISDVFDLSQYEYKYDKIIIKENLVWNPRYIELIAIPIPKESCDVKLFIIPKELNFINLDINTKSNYLAGISSWIGINRSRIQCSRCEKTKTNITIKITEYLLDNNINKKNINNYNLILEAEGLDIIDYNNKYSIYTHNDIIGDGKLVVILDDDDVISNSKFKFEKKYIHTKFVKSIINKLNNYGYKINNNNNIWNEITKAKNKFELDWNLTIMDLINIKNLHGSILPNKHTENKIDYIKNKIIESYHNKKKVILNFIMVGFTDDLKVEIYYSINQWITLMNNQSINIQFIELDDKDLINKIDIKFSFISINDESVICGSTYLIENQINIDINSDEDFTIKGLFELIVSHELGHAFGLIHNSDKNSIMYPFVIDINKNVSIQDVINILN